MCPDSRCIGNGLEYKGLHIAIYSKSFNRATPFSNPKTEEAIWSIEKKTTSKKKTDAREIFFFLQYSFLSRKYRS